MITYQARRLYRYLFLLVVGLVAVLLIGMDWGGAIPGPTPCACAFPPGEGEAFCCLMASPVIYWPVLA